MSHIERIHFLRDVFKMTAIALVLVINNYIIFWDILYIGDENDNTLYEKYKLSFIYERTKWLHDRES